MEDTLDWARSSRHRHVEAGAGGAARHTSEVEVQRVFEEEKPGTRNFTAHRYRQTPEESEEEDSDRQAANYTRRIYSVSASGARGQLSRTDSGTRQLTEDERLASHRGSTHFDRWSTTRTSTEKPDNRDASSRSMYIRRYESASAQHRWSNYGGTEDDKSTSLQSRRYGPREYSTSRSRWSSTTEQPGHYSGTSMYEGQQGSYDRSSSQHRWSSRYSTERPDRPIYTHHRSSVDRSSASRHAWLTQTSTERSSWSTSETMTTDMPEEEKSGSTYVRQQYHSITAGRHPGTTDRTVTSSEALRREHWGASGQHRVEGAGYGRGSDHDESKRWTSHRVTSAEDTTVRGQEERRLSWHGGYTARFGEHGNTTRRVDVGSRTRFEPTVIGPPSRGEYDRSSVDQRHRLTTWRNTTVAQGGPTRWSEDTQRRYGGRDDLGREHDGDTTYTRTTYTRRVNGTTYYGAGHSSRWLYGRENITSGSSVSYGSSRASGTYGGLDGETEPPYVRPRPTETHIVTGGVDIFEEERHPLTGKIKPLRSWDCTNWVEGITRSYTKYMSTNTLLHLLLIAKYL